MEIYSANWFMTALLPSVRAILDFSLFSELCIHQKWKRNFRKWLLKSNESWTIAVNCWLFFFIHLRICFPWLFKCILKNLLMTTILYNNRQYSLAYVSFHCICAFVCKLSTLGIWFTFLYYFFLDVHNLSEWITDIEIIMAATITVQK